MKTILKGHTTPETAYIVNDYPYGFRLRCKIRYWLEYKPGHGARLVSQTTNPKKPGEAWNKPKASTYCDLAACMYLNDEEHVAWSGLTFYADYQKAVDFLQEYREGLTETMIIHLEKWIEAKRIYEEKQKAGMSYQQAGFEAVRETKLYEADFNSNGRY